MRGFFIEILQTMNKYQPILLDFNNFINKMIIVNKNNC